MATAFNARTDFGDALALLTRDSRESFGDDITVAEAVMLSDAPIDRKQCALMQWMVRDSPCMFARMGARAAQGVSLHLCWLERRDIDQGDDHVTRVIQRERRNWKDKAAQGRSSAFLVMFNDERLARARPDRSFVELLRRLCDCYLVERAPIQTDLIYTESVPFESDGTWSVFRAGVNLFYPTAHDTTNHDRRVPGGVMISVNSPGHLANAQLRHGIAPSFEAATKESLRIAKLSIGRGGIASDRMKSCSWHNMIDDGRGGQAASDRNYSAVYHTDVLIPTAATVEKHANDTLPWNDLRFDYISTRPAPIGHPNYGLFIGHPIDGIARYDNPWPPRRPDSLEDVIDG